MSDRSQSIPGVHITPLGVTRREGGDGLRGMMGGDQAAHTLVSITLDPGASLPEGYVYSSLVLRVNRGRVEVVPIGGTATVTVGTGKPVRPGPRRRPICETGSYRLADGEKALLAPGNALSITGGEVSVKAVSRQPAEIQMSMVLPDTGENLCWICPHVNDMVTRSRRIA